LIIIQFKISSMIYCSSKISLCPNKQQKFCKRLYCKKWENDSLWSSSIKKIRFIIRHRPYLPHMHLWLHLLPF